MTKEQFLAELNKALRGINESERKDMLRDYEEHFELGLEEGKREEEIAAALGSPSHIAKELRAEYHLEAVQKTASTGNIMRAIWAVIGLGFFNLVVVLGPLIALAGVMFAGWCVGVSFILSPLAALFEVIISPGQFRLFDLFSSLVLSGLGLFIAMGMYVATKIVVRGFIKYLKFNTSMVKGGLKG